MRDGARERGTAMASRGEVGATGQDSAARPRPRRSTQHGHSHGHGCDHSAHELGQDLGFCWRCRNAKRRWPCHARRCEQPWRAIFRRSALKIPASLEAEIGMQNTRPRQAQAHPKLHLGYLFVALGKLFCSKAEAESAGHARPGRQLSSGIHNFTDGYLLMTHYLQRFFAMPYHAMPQARAARWRRHGQAPSLASSAQGAPGGGRQRPAASKATFKTVGPY